jgi:putative oxidoreductase
MRHLGLLILRVATGGLLAGHGAQKLFGWFGGHGLGGTAGWLESLGLRPGSRWALLAGAGEFGGGALTALGLLHPIGPLMMLGPMSIAVLKVHWGKPIWATEGGAELPVTNMAVGLALACTIPGQYSLDHLWRIRTPRALVALVTVSVVMGVAAGLFAKPAALESRPSETAGAELLARPETIANDQPDAGASL